MRRPWPALGCSTIGKTKLATYYLKLSTIELITGII
jgi:hypothetical protein